MTHVELGVRDERKGAEKSRVFVAGLDGDGLVRRGLENKLLRGGGDARDCLQFGLERIDGPGRGDAALRRRVVRDDAERNVCHVVCGSQVSSGEHGKRGGGSR